MIESNRYIYFGLAALAVIAWSDPLLGVPVADLRVPLKAMKDEVW